MKRAYLALQLIYIAFAVCMIIAQIKLISAMRSNLIIGEKRLALDHQKLMEWRKQNTAIACGTRFSSK